MMVNSEMEVEMAKAAASALQEKQDKGGGVGEAVAAAPFTAGPELWELSPNGVVRCAYDWLLSCFDEKKVDRRLDSDLPGFAAAGRALESYPKLFVGAGEVSWSDTPLEPFWRMAFRARARGDKLIDFKAVLGALDKADLGKGARLMLIAAAKERDADSFKELLAMGAARRSKLVMFSAYENGGKKVAEAVKQPTALEAVELLNKGGSGNYWREASVRHDWEGLDWLMEKAGGSLQASMFAGICANSTERSMALKAVEKYKFNLSDQEEYNYERRERGVPPRDLQIALVALGLAASGCPEAAKVFCSSQKADELWTKLCSSGLALSGSISIRALIGDKGGKASFVPDGKGPRLTMQAAGALSREEDAVKWLRGEYAQSGLKWEGDAVLAKIYAQFTEHHGGSKSVADIAGASIALSEAVDMRVGLESSPRTPKSSARRASL